MSFIKKLIPILIISLLFISNIGLCQNYNWIIPNKVYLKLYVADDGMYRITKTDFDNAGISTTGINPRTVKVYNKGVELPIYFQGEQDSVFNTADYFDFYGRRNYGGLTKTYTHTNIVYYTTNEYYNSYSDTNVYWVEWGVSNGLRFATTNYSTSNLYPSQFFYDKLHFEKDNLYSKGENLNSLGPTGFTDLKFLSTEKFKGESWYWAQLFNSQIVSDTFSTPFLYTTPQNASIRIFAYPMNVNNSIPNEHSVQVTINGTIVNRIYSNDFNKIDTTINFSSSLLSNSIVNNVTLKYIPDSTFYGAILIDLFEIQYPRIFKFNNNQLSSNLGGTDTTSKQFRISGYVSSNPINIYDVFNNLKITNFSSSSDTLIFTGKSNSNLQILNKNITKKPFRIKQRQVPNLVSSSNGVDYLLIYNKLFLSQTEQLRAYRESHDGFRSFKAEIEEIYDIFNYGNEDPIAVKNFVKYVYDNWQLPKIKYICLFGRGSLDPKRNSSSSTYYNNFIPVYGNPPSDGYFSNINTGTFFYKDQIAIGRLPAYTVSEAQIMVDKIITYETQTSLTPEEWWKTFSFITAGATASQQQGFQQLSDIDINFVLTQFPLYGIPHKVYRNDTSGSTTYNYADSIKNDINRGTLFVNFRGPAGSHDWEIAMTDPNTLSNGNKLPFVLSLTCFTGENAESSFRGFGEKFLYLNNKGAVGYLGTTGWSYAGYGDYVGTHVLVSIQHDTTRRLGNAVIYAGNRMSSDSLLFEVRHTINSYKLLGDPATKLVLPVRPEFDIRNTDYKLSDDNPLLGEPVTLTIYPKNFGIYADSCKIRFRVNRYNQTHSLKDTVLRAFKNRDSAKYTFKTDTNGIYSIVVTLDVNNRFPLENKNNNTLLINLNVKSNSFIPLKPVNNSTVSGSNVHFLGLNPYVNRSTKTVKVILQLDTTKQFNSPISQTFINSNLTGPVTKFETPIPILIKGKIYYWRTNALINNDSAGWSKTQTFFYVTSDTGEPDNANSINSNEVISILKNNANQFSETDFNNTSFMTNGIKLNESPATLTVFSYGSNAEEASYFTVGNQNVFIDGSMNNGLNLLKVKKLTGSIHGFKNIKMTSALSSDTVVNFLNTFDTTHYLMLLNASYVEFGVGFTQAAKDKIRQFGSIYCDSISPLGYFHTWSFIGFLGASHSQVSEMYDPCCYAPQCPACSHWTASSSTMNVTFKKYSGTVSIIAGPAQYWYDFSWVQSLYSNSSLSFDVYGIDNNEQQTLLLSNQTSNDYLDLASISTFEFPKLNFLAKFDIDTSIGTQSSILSSVKLNYNPSAELILDNNSLEVTSTYRVGDDLKFGFNYFNVGFSDLNGIIINAYKKSITHGNLIFTDTISSALKIDSMKYYSNKFKVPYFRDSLKVYIDIKPKDGYTDSYTFNNTVDISMKSSTPVVKSILDVFTDGQPIKNGDYVRPAPEIKISLSKQNSSMPLLSDTTQVALRLNDKYVPYFIKGNMNPVLKTLEEDNSKSELELENAMILFYYPNLIDGTNKLSIIYKDDEDNIDTVSYDVIVSNELSIKDLYNYPNPMKEQTNFMFNLTGSDTPGRFKIKIYTVSGKLIKEIESPVNIGFNQIPWDGKDSDGDFVANGTYLYKLVTEDDSKIETQIQKLVMLK